MDERFDCIVIGSGCGGAASAALAAFRGRKVLLLEKNGHVGGRCATLEVRGFKMDHGHMISRCAKGPHGEVLRLVRCQDLIPSYASTYYTPDRVQLLDKTFSSPPRDLGGKVRWIRDRIKAFGLGFSDLAGMGRMALRAALMSEKELKRMENVSMEEFIAPYVRNKYVLAMIGSMTAVGFGALPHDASAGEMIRAWKPMLKDNSVGYPLGGEGVAAIPKSFLKAAGRYGAEVRLNAPVKRIIVEDGTVRGVECGTKMIAADMVISNAGLRETVLYLVGEEHFEKSYVNRIKNLKYSYGGISLKYALDKKIVDFETAAVMPENFFANMQDAMEGRIPEKFSMMLVCTSSMDPGLAPEGRQILLAIMPGPVAEPGKIKWNKWVERAKAQVEAFVPGLAEHVLFCIASTPDMIAKETGRTFGDAVGVAQTMDQAGGKAPSAVSPIRGLYFTGADIGSRGMATEMATQSAIDLFEHLDGKGKLK